MQLVYGVVLGEPARKRLLAVPGLVKDSPTGMEGLPTEIDPAGVYGLPDKRGNTVVGCLVIEFGYGGGDPLPLAKLERHLREDIKSAKRCWKGLAAWVAEKGKGKIRLGKPGLVLVLED